VFYLLCCDLCQICLFFSWLLVRCPLIVRRISFNTKGGCFNFICISFNSKAISFNSKAIPCDSNVIPFNSKAVSFNSKAMSWNYNKISFNSNAIPLILRMSSFNSQCISFSIDYISFNSSAVPFNSNAIPFGSKAIPLLLPKLVKRLVTKLTPYIEHLQILDFSMDVARNAANIRTAVDAWVKLGCEFAKPHYAALFSQLKRFVPILYLGTYRALLASAMATHPATVHASLTGTNDLPQPELAAWGAEPGNSELMTNLIAASIMARFNVLSGGPSGSRTPTEQPIADALSAFNHDSDEEVVAPQAAAPAAQPDVAFETEPADEAQIEKAARKAARRARRAADCNSDVNQQAMGNEHTFTEH